MGHRIDDTYQRAVVEEIGIGRAVPQCVCCLLLKTASSCCPRTAANAAHNQPWNQHDKLEWQK